MKRRVEPKGRPILFRPMELLLYVVLAVFLAISPLITKHWLLVRGIAVILCLAVCGRVVHVVAEKTGRSERPPAEPIPIFKQDGISVIIAGMTYAALVLAVWGQFAWTSGMGYETGFSYNSETSSPLSGFVDFGDPMRPFTNLFYHVSYLLSLWCGIPGSFAPFQFVYATLWSARGLLVFLVLTNLLRGRVFLCYIAGALVIVHASDGSLQWVGQLNQFGYIFWLLLAVYLFLRAGESGNTPLGTYVWSVCAYLCVVLCLGSYESALPILLLVPLLAWLARRRLGLGFLISSAAWYGALMIYVFLTLHRYQHSGGASYQASVLRTDWRISSIANDLLFNVRASLFFWNWPDIGPLDLSRGSIVVWTAAAVAAFCLGSFFMAARENRWPQPPLPHNGVLGTLLASGFMVLVLSFPAYLLLNSARTLWRTQILSGIGTAIVLTSIFGLLLNLATKRRWLQYAGCIAAGSLVVYFGAHHAIIRGSFHRGHWERHRRAVAAIVRTVPNVKPGTLFVLSGIPHGSDPFGDAMWLDLALRLSYSGTKVAGSYYYAGDGAPAPGNAFQLQRGEWVKVKTGFPPLVEKASVRDSLILEYDGRNMRILPKVPAYMCAGVCDDANYEPGTRIVPGQPPARAINRYGPID
jgi:hypothetical protein